MNHGDVSSSAIGTINSAGSALLSLVHLEAALRLFHLPPLLRLNLQLREEQAGGD